MAISHELSQGSSSSSSSSLTYDVFLSFRGIDTRLNFTNHLHKALEDANLITFLDDQEIDTTLYLKPELESAIKASRSSIIVLSKNYASSTWCLEELALILEQHKTSSQMVFPIFYHVNPTDVRKQQNSFGDAMERHKQRMEAETNVEEKSLLAQKMVTWKKALTEVTDLEGKDAKGRLETEFIEAIVTDIKRCLGIPLWSTLPDLIGMDCSVRFISSWLKDGSTHTADILTILGMDGIGKTSLAKYVYDMHHILFNRRSFVVDINRKCRDEYDKLLELQMQVLVDISETSSERIPVQFVSVYTSKIEKALARNKVLLVLDDIDSLDQLNVLLGGKGFHPGSKIIITTKDASLARRYKLSNPLVQPNHTTLSLEGLNETSSLQLLSFHAFKRIGPTEGYKQVCKKLFKFCERLPLVLKVLGCSLCDQDVAEWEEYIGGLEHETDSTYRRVLQMSFDSLPSQNDKELFKHIACFFVGMDRDYTETILKACGIRTLHGIRNLLDRCLIAIGPRNELMMHQLLQDMGKDMVHQESHDKPWKRSRLWRHKDSFNVLQQKKGKGSLKGIVLDMRMLEKEELHGSLKLRTDALSKMDNLMLLQLNYVQLKGSYKNFPKQLRWLCMHGFPSRSIPFDLQMENLVALDMSYSKIKKFDMSCSNMKQLSKTLKLTGHSKDKRLLGSLKILNLSFCEQLRSLGGFFEFPALERLIVTNCIDLTEVSESIEQCVELVIIDLSYCKKLEKLPTTLGKLKKVKKLLLHDCNLRNPPVEMRDRDSQEMARTEIFRIDSQTSSSAITETVPHHPEFFRVSAPSSLEQYNRNVEERTEQEQKELEHKREENERKERERIERESNKRDEQERKERERMEQQRIEQQEEKQRQQEEERNQPRAPGKSKSWVSLDPKKEQMVTKDGQAANIAAQTFTFRELAAATKNFRRESLLGKSGFGRVYKGRLESTGQVVAVKQLDRNGLQGNREFLVEVLMLSLLHHPNLVNLIGYCADGDQRLLVYEFMPLGSLEDHLHDLAPDKEPLDWNTRMKIAAGAAKGLEYLHDKANPPVIYRDLKSSNILLDEGGIAKLGPVGDKTHVSTRVMGTYGYYAPEYAMTGQLTLKSDVYSFGVIFLELITGRKAIDNTRAPGEHNLVAWARPLFKDRRKFPKMADPLLQGHYPVSGLYQALAVAAICLQEQAATRPLIGDVVTVLTYLASQTYDPEAARAERAARGSGSGTPRSRTDRRNPSDGGLDGLDDPTLALGSPSTYKNSPDYRKRESLREINTRSDIGDGESSNGGNGSGRKWGVVDDPDSQRNSPANTSRARETARNRDLDRERAVAEAIIWGENWRDRKRTNTMGGSFDATNE